MDLLGAMTNRETLDSYAMDSIGQWRLWPASPKLSKRTDEGARWWQALSKALVPADRIVEQCAETNALTAET